MADDYSVIPAGSERPTDSTARAPFGYYGAKLRIAQQIIRSLPLHNAWVEAFCGSAAITVGKPPAPIEVINDRDSQIVNLFQQLRDNSEALCSAVALTPYAREEWELARQPPTEATPLEKARKFLVATMMTVNATFGSDRSGFSFSQSYSRENKEARVSRWYNLPERLAKVVERLRHIRIENRDACELVTMFSNRPATLMYLDPPYFVKREHKYVIDANDREFHINLLKRCLTAKCMILISGYGNELYDEMLTKKKGWTKSTISTHTRDTKGTMYSKTEVLWKNAHFIKAYELGRVPIRLTAKESAQNKVNPPRR